jgi:hypothetical protein
VPVPELFPVMAMPSGLFDAAVHLQKLKEAVTVKKSDVPFEVTDLGFGLTVKVQVEADAWLMVRRDEAIVFPIVIVGCNGPAALAATV